MNIHKVKEDAAASLESMATPQEKRIHDVLLKWDPRWDPDQRWACAMELADAANGNEGWSCVPRINGE